MYSSHCIEHVRCHIAFVREVARISKVGAKVEIRCPDALSEMAMVYGHTGTFSINVVRHMDHIFPELFWTGCPRRLRLVNIEPGADDYWFPMARANPLFRVATRREALIQALDMADIGDRRTEGFSQGQRVKTAIARALVHDPRNVILDEPTNGLDVMATRALRQFMLQLKAQGRCVLFSSHIMQEVAALCDRIVVIAHGRVVADESPQALREQTGESNLEDAFVKIIGSDEGLAA